MNHTCRKSKKWFEVILTDRVSEFLDYYALEKSFKGKGRITAASTTANR